MYQNGNKVQHRHCHKKVERIFLKIFRFLTILLAYNWANRWRGYSFTCLSFDGWVCTLKSEYPFIKHIPIVIVMSISHFSNCARMCHMVKLQDRTYFLVCSAFPFGMERITDCYNLWAAPRGAMTNNRHNDTPVQSQPHAMRAVAWEPCEGA